MEAVKVSSCGGAFLLHYFSGTRARGRQPPPSAGSRRRWSPRAKPSCLSDLCAFGIPSLSSGHHHASSVGYRALFPARPILSSRIQSIPEEVAEISHSGDGIVPIDVGEGFHNPRGKTSSEVPTVATRTSIRNANTLARVNLQLSEGILPPYFLYLMDLGLDLEQIKKMTSKFPGLSYLDVERKIKPFVKFLVDLGIPHSDVPKVLCRCPKLCSFSIQENLRLKISLLESLGVDGSHMATIVVRYPGILMWSKQKLKATAKCFSELGLSDESIGKLLTRAPQLFGRSIEENLVPTMACLESLGVDKSRMGKIICRSPKVLYLSRQKLKETCNYFSQLGLSAESVGKLLMKFPQVFGFSIEGKIKPTTEFLLDKGFTNEEIGMMVSEHGSIYSLSLEKSLIPKWEFFLQMGYPKSELVEFPSYFGHSLERRIKPRYYLVREHGIRFTLYQLLRPSDEKFQSILESNILADV